MAWMRSRVASLMRSSLCRARETVESDTEAISAISFNNILLCPAWNLLLTAAIVLCHRPPAIPSAGRGERSSVTIYC